MWSHGHFYWNERMTRDADKVKAFYAESLGWTFNAMAMPTGATYWVAMLGDKPVGGIFPMEGPDFEGVPEHWFAYIAVDNVDERLKRAQRGGAQVVRPPFDVPEVGRIAILQEPGGAMIGWMTPPKQP